MSVGPEVQRSRLPATVAQHETRIVALERTPSIHTLIFIIDTGDADTALEAGRQQDIQLHARYEIRSWTLLADQDGSIVMDVWKDVYANFPPTDADSITNGAPPTISGDDHATSEVGPDADDWSVTRVDKGDCFRVNIDSVSNISRIALMLELHRF